ncbi:MAG: hypothetical protein GY727_11870, partial [Gammaproteobacteria bacterium]|nr:hypothetical protein [Gammaproteobacteria bacterium]
MASVKITTLETAGALQLSGVDVTLNQVITKADIDAGNLKFVPVANANGSSYDSFAFSVNDGTADSASSYTLTVDVTAVNDVPVFLNLGVGTLAYTEGEGAVVIDNTVAAVIDVDSTNFDTGTLTVSFNAGSDDAEDVLAIRNQGSGPGQIGLNGSDVEYGGEKIGSFSGGSNGTPLTILLESEATPTTVTALMQNITYENTDTSDPTTGSRTVRFVLTDGDGGTSANYDTTVTFTAVNDEPTLTATGSDPTFTEGDSAVGLFSGAAVSTVESGQTITGLTFTVTNVTDTGYEQITIDSTTITLDDAESGSTTDFSYSVSVSGTTATVTLSGGTASTAAVVSDINNATYINNSQAPTDANRVVTITEVVDSGGTANSGDNTGTPVATSTINVDPVNDAPTAANNTVTTNEDTTYTFTASDFSFSDVDGDTMASIKITTLETVGALQLSGVDVTLNQVITKANIDAGNLKFVPVANANGSSYDSFAFSVN